MEVVGQILSELQVSGQNATIVFFAVVGVAITAYRLRAIWPQFSKHWKRAFRPAPKQRSAKDEQIPK